MEVVYPICIGNPELDRLWNLGVDNIAFLTSKDRELSPAVKDYLLPLREQMEPDAGIEEEYKLKNDKVSAELM